VVEKAGRSVKILRLKLVTSSRRAFTHSIRISSGSRPTQERDSRPHLKLDIHKVSPIDPHVKPVVIVQADTLRHTGGSLHAEPTTGKRPAVGARGFFPPPLAPFPCQQQF
jgi:hypothetical protein